MKSVFKALGVYAVRRIGLNKVRSDPVHLRLLRLMKLLGRNLPSLFFFVCFVFLFFFFFFFFFFTRFDSLASGARKIFRPGF